MNQIRFKPTGTHIAVALVAVVIFAGVKCATLGEVGDPTLHEAVRGELLMELGNRIGKDLKTVDRKDEASLTAFTQRADAEKIEVHSVKVSKPLLSIGSSTEAVVRVEYTLPGGPRQTGYWRCEHSLAAGWRFRWETGASAYYLNFI